MSKQEIYAWCSLGFSSAVLAYYIIWVFGLPLGLENYAEQITSLLWKIIAVTFVVEFILDLLNSTTFGGIQKDERDFRIEFKGFRNAYYFLMAAIVFLIGHILLNDFMSNASGGPVLLTEIFGVFHILVLILFGANILKSATQIVHYQRGI